MKGYARLGLFVLFASCVVCEVLCPYTKVEESFGMQAMHDFIFCPAPDCWDHHEFPGVVPRTFVGPWIVVALTLLIVTLVVEPIGTVVKYTFLHAGFLSNIMDNKKWIVEHPFFLEVTAPKSPMFFSHACRLVLGSLVCGALWYVATGIDEFENKIVKSTARPTRKRCSASFIFFLLCILQFHLLFYATRALPNTYALILCSLACGCTLRGMHYHSIALLNVSAAVFRCDTILLLGSSGLFLLLQRDVTLVRSALVSFFSLVLAFGCSVVLDSFLWGRWLWPEANVLFFNTVENQSWRWGRLPWHWYVTYALPRAFLFEYMPLLLLVSLASWDLGRRLIHLMAAFCSRAPAASLFSLSPYSPSSSSIRGALFSLWLDTGVRYRAVLLPAALFVFLYSFLPHKELRFIMVVFPNFLAPVAAAVSLTWNELIAREGDGSAHVKDGNGKTVLQQPERGNASKQRKYKHVRYEQRMKRVTMAVFLCLFLLQLMTVVMSVYFSIHNYPGADALKKLHQIIEKDIFDNNSCANRLGVGSADQTVSLTVFIDAYAGMTGINRFQKAHHLQPPGQLVDGRIGYLPLYPSSLRDRLVALFALPFVALLHLSEGITSPLGRFREYHDGDLYGTMGGPSTASDAASVFLSGADRRQLRGVQLRYTKDPTLFDEERGVYKSDGLDYLLVRYSQREMHRQHGVFEELFTASSDFCSHVAYWLRGFWPWRCHLLFFNERAEKPFILALRRRCRE
ncbi:putative dolichyl-P-Man:GDP-Man7GlcNAc2-PP-dolichyl alpha-1,6-mannosyltransferase [Trypanosoma cruzi]|nr:putative dolichyl-P-Man:GDP-Man7GlcNAc2-PP-dolichyl alpha-1,6-mannosyltransferase [Trypanosoma cruzi]RNC55481.1 putative dolichyl-P-Man:GDP-Man7GlcNAc2-PP-dolichyl alpha-1,6-mannosyltransferase [Trypanosoma cruzi]